MATPSKPAQKTARAVEGPRAGAAGNQARVHGERRRSGGRSSSARAERAKELTTTDRPLAFRFHRRHLLWFLSSAANRASPDSSYCVFLWRSPGSAKAS